MERPALSIRSTKGCWTCRLRKKKCDEVRPGCLRCESVNIDCHYGARPPWIEDPVLGKEELERVKKIVGVAASRKRAEHRVKSRSLSGNTAVTNFVIPPSPVISPGLRGGSAHGLSRTSHSALDSPATGTPNADSTWLSKWIRDEEANLIMHYLDHVFYIQFRFHTPAIAKEGRGWFLSLLIRTKPLYHAALSLSAFHQQSVALERGSAKTDYLQELEVQHNLTLKELQLFIQAESLTSSSTAAFERNVQILACIVLLVSFELFNGGTSNWQFHLKAASEIVLLLHESEPPESPMSDRQKPLKIQSTEKAALKFFTGSVLWFDILSSVSTGLPSPLAGHHERLLSGPDPATGSQIELDPIIGCRNWPMILIGEISALAAQKPDWKRIVDYKVQSFEDAAQDMETRLLSHYRETRSELDAFCQQYGTPPPHSQRDIYARYTILVVTCVFASAAMIYLQVVKIPDVAPEHFEGALKENMEVLSMVPEPPMVRALVWPLCVSGCMASSPHDQNFFRSVAMSAINDSKSFGNSSIALDLLERSWALQSERGKLIDCTRTVREFGTCVLLV